MIASVLEVVAVGLLVQAPASDGAEQPPTTADAQPLSSDRVTLREGGEILGKVVALEPRVSVTIRLEGSQEVRTVAWIRVASVERAGQEPIHVSGPSMAELAAESDRIERQKNIGLGLAYVGLVSLMVAGGTWAGYGVVRSAEVGRENPLLVAAAVSTAVTVGLLTGGGVLFFQSQKRRKEWRKAALSGYASPQGAGVTATLRF